MNLTHLKYLIAVEKYESISKAASQLYINQPHLSKIIKDMEEEVNIKIFERHNKGVVPTKKGKQFLIQAKRIVHEVDHLEDMFQEHPNRVNLDIAVPRASYIAKAFTDFLNEVNSETKEVTVNYRETNTEDTIQRVYDGENDLGVIRIPEKELEYYKNVLNVKELEAEEIFRFDYLALMSKENPLVDKDITIEDLKHQIELFHGDVAMLETDTKQQKEIFIYERGIQFELLVNLKTSYMWVSPMPKVTLDRFSLVTKQCQNYKNTYVDLIIKRKGYTFTNENKLFINSIKKVTEELLKDE